MNQHPLVKMPERRTVQLGTPQRCVPNLGKAHNTHSKRLDFLLSKLQAILVFQDFQLLTNVYAHFFKQ